MSYEAPEESRAKDKSKFFLSLLLLLSLSVCFQLHEERYIFTIERRNVVVHSVIISDFWRRGGKIGERRFVFFRFELLIFSTSPHFFVQTDEAKEEIGVADLFSQREEGKLVFPSCINFLVGDEWVWIHWDGNFFIISLEWILKSDWTSFFFRGYKSYCTWVESDSFWFTRRATSCS